jgi:hypothetical protein
MAEYQEYKTDIKNPEQCRGPGIKESPNQASMTDLSFKKQEWQRTRNIEDRSRESEIAEDQVCMLQILRIKRG